MNHLVDVANFEAIFAAFQGSEVRFNTLSRAPALAEASILRAAATAAAEWTAPTFTLNSRVHPGQPNSEHL